MIKKIAAFFTAVVMALALAGCSGEYVMTEEDLALQKSIEGYWAADTSTDYNTFDENGNLICLVVIEFTDDFNYIMHNCMINERYSMSYPPIPYSFEDKMFKVVNEGVPSYAKVSVSSDGSTMYWITDEGTDTYMRLDKETATSFGIPEYDPAKYAGTGTESGSGEDASSETQESGNVGSDGE
ncbi:MAG: hypothetical protein ACI4KG_03480 [Oscillospiraceae bacterium]